MVIDVTSGKTVFTIPNTNRLNYNRDVKEYMVESDGKLLRIIKIVENNQVESFEIYQLDALEKGYRWTQIWDIYQHEAHQKISQFSPQRGQDKLIWIISPSGNFFVRSIYGILSQGGKIRSTVAAFWKAKKRNLPFAPGCVLCASGASETTMHLFFQCPYAMHLWSGLSATLGFSLLHAKETVQPTFLSSTPHDKIRLQQWTVYFISITCNLWKERNNRTFRHARIPYQLLAL